MRFNFLRSSTLAFTLIFASASLGPALHAGSNVKLSKQQRKALKKKEKAAQEEAEWRRERGLDNPDNFVEQARVIGCESPNGEKVVVAYDNPRETGWDVLASFRRAVTGAGKFIVKPIWTVHGAAVGIKGLSSFDGAVLPNTQGQVLGDLDEKTLREVVAEECNQSDEIQEIKVDGYQVFMQASTVGRVAVFAKAPDENTGIIKFYVVDREHTKADEKGEIPIFPVVMNGREPVLLLNGKEPPVIYGRDIESVRIPEALQEYTDGRFVPYKEEEVKLKVRYPVEGAAPAVVQVDGIGGPGAEP